MCSAIELPSSSSERPSDEEEAEGCRARGGGARGGGVSGTSLIERERDGAPRLVSYGTVMKRLVSYRLHIGS